MLKLVRFLDRYLDRYLEIKAETDISVLQIFVEIINNFCQTIPINFFQGSACTGSHLDSYLFRKSYGTHSLGFQATGVSGVYAVAPGHRGRCVTSLTRLADMSS